MPTPREMVVLAIGKEKNHHNLAQIDGPASDHSVFSVLDGLVHLGSVN